MTETELYEQRKTAIHLLRGGMSVSEVTRELERSVSWVYKCQTRYEQEGWAGLYTGPASVALAGPVHISWSLQ